MVKAYIYTFLYTRNALLLGVVAICIIQLSAILFFYLIKVDWNAVHCTPTHALPHLSVEAAHRFVVESLTKIQLILLSAELNEK